jgi:hypothetical protein
LTPAMIVNEKGAPVEPADVDAPPAYDELESGRDSARFAGDQKAPNGPGGYVPQAGPSSSRETNQASPRSSQQGAAGHVPSGTKTWFSWFSEKDTRMEVKRTIQSLVSRKLQDNWGVL